MCSVVRVTTRAGGWSEASSLFKHGEDWYVQSEGQEFYLTAEGIRTVHVPEVVMDLKDPMVKYSLYGSDAVHLASALMTGCEVIWTEDIHFHGRKLCKDMMVRGLKALSLKDR